MADQKPDLSVALTHHRAGRLDEAIAGYRLLLERDPRDESVIHLLGLAHLAAGRSGEAEALLRHCLELRPHFPEAMSNLGRALLARGRPEEALEVCRRACAFSPPHPDRLGTLGNALQALSRHEEAIAAYREALALKPGMTAALNRLGNSCRMLGRLDEAVAAFEQALQTAPANAEAWNNLANTYCDTKQFDLADQAYARALEASPDSADIKFNRALGWLLRGDFRRGWEEFDCRWQLKKGARQRDFKAPLWTGREDLQGKTILVHAEQGLGDTIQFVRYVPRLARERGAVVYLEVQPALRRLLAGVPGAAAVIVRGKPLPACDWHSPLMSLPKAFGTEVHSIPAKVPYLAALPGATAPWRALLEGAPRPRVGLVWAGNRRHPNDRARSLPAGLLRKALEGLPGTFLSLQKGPRPEDRERPTGAGGWVDLSPRLRDFADTAAAVSALDLVITVDTAVAHLAGALGAPAWVLLPYAPDWRWLLEREDSPWYPTLRLFRQPRPNDWEPVLARVRAAWPRP